MKPCLRTRPAVLSLILATLFLSACNEERPETLLASARDYLAKNDTRSAIIQVKNALQKKPDSAEGRFLLGKALLETGDPAGAELEARKALDLRYPADRATPLLAKAMVAQGKAGKAIAEFSNLEPSAPEDRADLQTVLGLAHAAQGNFRAAEAAFAKALEAQPGFGPALTARARVKAAGRDYAGALALVDSTLAREPGNPDAWKLKGDLLGAQSKGEEALAAYRKALEVRPDFMPAHVATVSALIDRGQMEEAARQLDALKKAAPNDLQTRYLEVLLAFRKTDYKSAHDLVQPLVQLVPDNPKVLQMAGAVAYQQNGWRAAETHLAKALSLAPDLPLARRLLISAYLQGGQPGKAMAVLQPVLDTIGNDPQMLALAGQVHIQNGDVQKAEQYFSKAAALDPADPGKRTSLALTHLVKGQVDTGLGELERIAATDKGTVADLALIASLMEKHRFDKALQAIAALEKKQPGQPLPHDLRGRTLAAIGRTADARRSFEQALAANSAYFSAVAALTRLDINEGKPDEARKRLEALLTSDPKNVQALLALAEVRRQTGGKPEETAALLTRAMAAAPTDSGPRLALIDHYLRSKDAARAVSAAQEAASALPDRREILNALGTAQLAAKDYQQALSTYGKVAGLDRDSPQPYLRMADVLLAAGNGEEALRSLRRALEVSPGFVEAQRRMIQFHIEAGRKDEALAVAREVQRQHPAQPIGFLLEGDIRAADKNWDGAAAAYRAGLKLAPTAELAVKLHDVLDQQGGGEAEKFAAAWTREHPRDAAFVSHLGDLALARRDQQGAARHYRAALEIQSDNAPALNNLAWILGQQKNPQALEYAEKANRLAPNQPALMDTLAVLLLEKGDSKRALDLLRRAVELAPGASHIRLNFAKALIQGGDRAAARKELEELNRLGEKFSGHNEIAKLMSQV